MLKTPLLVAVLLLASPVEAASLEDEARAFVEKWRVAQNSGDFAAYQALYATRFTGIRRSGPREVRLDRAGWLKDRGRMFRKPMKVEVEGLVVYAAKHEFEVVFVQRFAQGNYQDQGRKTMVLVRDATGLHIAREELHDSVLEKAPAAPAGDLIGLADPLGVVLSTDLDAGWAKGDFKVSVHDGAYATLQAVDAAKVPAALKLHVGKPVQVIDVKGQPCETTVKRLRISNSVTPHFGSVQSWKQDKTPDADIASQVLEMAGPDGDRLIGQTDPACKDGLVVRKAGATAPIFVGQELKSGPQRAAVIAALRKHTAYAALRADMKKESPEAFAEHKGRWEGDPTVTAFDVTVNGVGKRWLSVSFFRFDSCAEWSGELWGLYEVKDAADVAAPTLLNKPGETYVLPAFAVDLDGDGTPELVYRQGGIGDLDLDAGFIKKDGGRFKKRIDLRTPYHDCPC